MDTLAIKIYRISHFFIIRKLGIVSKLFDGINRFMRNSYIPGSVEIGKGTYFAYGGIALVIHPRVKIGNHCLIGQGITIGGRSGLKDVPVVEDRCYLGAGCRILGDIVIGHDSIIGPNAVVTKNIPPYSVVTGVPGKITNTITEENFRKYQSYGVAPPHVL
jgi:serine O-acetyltransferase